MGATKIIITFEHASLFSITTSDLPSLPPDDGNGGSGGGGGGGKKSEAIPGYNLFILMGISSIITIIIIKKFRNSIVV